MKEEESQSNNNEEDKPSKFENGEEILSKLKDEEEQQQNNGCDTPPTLSMEFNLSKGIKSVPDDDHDESYEQNDLEESDDDSVSIII